MGKDPAQLIEEGHVEALRTALRSAPTLTTLVVQEALTCSTLSHVEGRVSAVRAIAEKVAVLPPAALSDVAALLTVTFEGGLAGDTIASELIAASLAHQAS
ncbi:hypothetical protein [Paraoerskovia sediminicola]|uniref:hypothetical protein n=1 Tax=Paraoerskovia sediminicola TaxID=1138587 RepID=UPI0025742DC3|nr:hypothetical protein [Paraoerskovia sediminicola]